VTARLHDQMTTVDHRRAIADRNRAAILDAVETMLAQRTPLSMAAVASAAGVSRPTLYAHFRTLGDVIEAAVARAVDNSLASIEAADTGTGPAAEALERMVEASWGHLATVQALAHGAAEYLPPEHLRRTHAPLMALTAQVVERGRRDGTIRADLPTTWLVTAYYALIHNADDLARTQAMKREGALAVLKTTLRDLFRPR
jgi:TetR/AcrR family transcriptional regulator, mexCD-oprJ operon repressor